MFDEMDKAIETFEQACDEFIESVKRDRSTEKKPLMQMTTDDFEKIENFWPTKPFHDIVIVPTELHDSGFRAMKFVCIERGEIVGCIGGWSDVIRINGIGGYGLSKNYGSRQTDVVAWKIDCLPGSNYLRVMCDRPIHLDTFIGSDFQLLAEVR